MPLRNCRAQEGKLHGETINEYKALIKRHDAKDEETYKSHCEERAEWASAKLNMAKFIDHLIEQNDAWCVDLSDAVVAKEDWKRTALWVEDKLNEDLNKPPCVPETPAARKRSLCHTPCPTTRSAAKRLRF